MAYLWYIIQTIYLLLPAYFANMAPVVARKINVLNYPIDLNKKFRGRRILGNHKTFRGLFIGTLVGTLVAYLQFALRLQLPFFVFRDWIVVGFLLSFGALLGDMVKSFFKRQVGVKPGKSFFPWDQTDFILGALILFSFYDNLGWEFWVVAIIASFILHIIVNHIAFWLHIRKEKW